VVKKRELNVERWLQAMEREKLYRDRLGQFAYALRHFEQHHEMTDVMYELQMAEFWRDAGMQVYEFDPDFSESILGEEWVDLLPDCINNRPHDCFYMKLPCGKYNEGTVVNIVDSKNIMGFDISLFPGAESGKGVYIGGDKRFSDDERVVVNTGAEILCLCSFAISKTMELMRDNTPLELYPAQLVANGVAYICSLNADIAESYVPQKSLRRNNAKRRSMAEWHEVGYRIGSELRSYKRAVSATREHKGGTVRPHMRRAHWQHYWTGPRNGDRKLILRWIRPTMVGFGSIESATGHKVR